MKKLNCLIIDDEKLAGELLQAYIERVPELRLMAVYTHPLAARSDLDTGGVDLLFLDINLPDISGISFLKSLNRPPQTILTTAYSEYAVESYKLDVVDYLVKPIEFDRFYKGVSKAMKARHRTPGHVRINEPDKPVSENFIFIKGNNKIHKIDFDDLYFVESLREYLRIYTSTERIITRMSMSRLTEELPFTLFFRVHRSYLVNLRRIDTIEGNIIKIGSHEIVLSKGRRKSFFELIEKYGLL